MEIGQKIRSARKAASLTQEQLASKSGVATITIRQYETGKRQPRIEQLEAIAAALGVSYASLLIPLFTDTEYLELMRKHDAGIATARELEQYNNMRRKRGIDPIIDDKVHPAAPPDIDSLRSNAVNQLEELNDEGVKMAADIIDTMHSSSKYNDKVPPTTDGPDVEE